MIRFDIRVSVYRYLKEWLVSKLIIIG